MKVKVGDIVMFQNRISPSYPDPYPDALVEVVEAPEWDTTSDIAWFAERLNLGIWVVRPGSTVGMFRVSPSELSPAPSISA